MAKIERRIRSCPDETCPLPWAELDVRASAKGIEVMIGKLNGLAAAEWTSADRAKEQRLVRRHSFAFDPDAERTEGGQRERHALAITVDGELIFVPFSKQPPILYAQLAFVDTETLDVEVLVFEEIPADPVGAVSAHVAHVKEA